MKRQNSNMKRIIFRSAAWLGCIVLFVLLACLWWNAEVQQVMPPRSVEHREQDSATTATDVESVEPSEEDEAAPSEELPSETAEAAPETAWPRGPWSSAFDQPGGPAAFEDVCFGDFDLTKSLLQRDDLLRWLTPEPGHDGQIRTVRARPGESAQWDGLFCLRMPWREDVALRLALTDYDGVQIHLLHGDRGTTLVYYRREFPNWVAYLTQRTGGSVRPERYVAAATDDGRTRRTQVHQGAPLELRCRAGQVMLSHGDVVLLRAPLESMPTECYFEGRATCYGIEAVRSQWPPDPPAAWPVVFDSQRPTELDWSEHLGDGSTVERTSDGAVELLAANAQQPAWIACPIPETGLREVVLQVEEATPGTGVFLAPDGSRPTLALRLLQDTHSGHMVAVLRDFDAHDARFPPVDQAFVSWAPRSFWVRLLFACGTVHWWISPDGRHWVAGDQHRGELNQPCTHFGLMHRGGLEQGRIRLRRAQVRLLPEFNALADPQLVRRATPWPQASDIEAWLTKTADSTPADVDADRWRDAGAVRTLGDGCGKPLGRQLIELLLDGAARQGLSLERRRALLAETSTLLATRDDWVERGGLLDRYHALGREAFRREAQRPYSWIRRDLMSVPMIWQGEMRVAREATVRAEIVQLSHEQRWLELLDFCRQLRYLRQDDVTPLTDWAESTALRYLPQAGSGQRLVRRRADWSPIWVEQVSTPTYNFLAELQGMLDSHAWEDAARLIASLDADLLQGLAPDVRDTRRYVALPTAVAAAVDANEPLRQIIREQYQDVAALRVGAAKQRGDVLALQLVTFQFAGTEAAAEAHRWLGDRALQVGRFATALVEYQRGLEAAGPVLRADLESRQRLAAALQGQRLEGRALSDVVFGQYRLSSEEFEQLIDELVSNRANQGARPVEVAPPAAPRPAGYRLEHRGRLTGPGGKEDANRDPLNASRFDVDWVGRQLATAVVDDTIFVSNRFHVSAYRLKDGQRLWQAVPEHAAPSTAHDWPLIPMRPLIHDDDVVARMLYAPAPMLVGIERSSGEIRWTSEMGPHESVISDPVIIQQQLAALTIVRQDQGGNLVQLTLFDRENGRVLNAFDLLRVNDVWWRRRCCELLVIDDSLIVTMAGVTFRCDLTGHVQWLRSETALPPEEDPRWITQSYQRPWRRGQLIYVVQPGVFSIDCLDARTGHRAWNCVLPDLQSILGLVDHRVIVQTDDRLLAFDADTGQILWEYPATGILQGGVCDSHGILFAQLVASGSNGRSAGIRLVWLDIETAAVVAVAPLPELNAAQARLGPLVLWRDRIWAFSAGRGGQSEPEILELVPQGMAEPAPR